VANWSISSSPWKHLLSTPISYTCRKQGLLNINNKKLHLLLDAQPALHPDLIHQQEEKARFVPLATWEDAVSSSSVRLHLVLVRGIYSDVTLPYLTLHLVHANRSIPESGCLNTSGGFTVAGMRPEDWAQEKKHYAGSENHSPHWLRKSKPLWYWVP